MNKERDWERLATFARAARGSRSQKAIDKAGGPSHTTLGKIERAEWRPTRGVDDTIAKLETVYGWEPGSVDAILAGGSPIREIHIDDDIRRKLHIRSGKLTSGGLPKGVPDYEPVAEDSATRLDRYLETKDIPDADRTIEQHLFMSQYEGELTRRRLVADRLVREEPLVDLVEEGHALAARKNDEDVSDYVRQVEATVVGVMGIYRLSTTLDGRAQERTIVRANNAGVLNAFMDETDRLRRLGIEGRELQRRMEGWLESTLTPAQDHIDLIPRTTGPSPVDDLTRNDAPPSQDELDLAARTTPPGYQPGRSEQGEADVD